MTITKERLYEMVLVATDLTKDLSFDLTRGLLFQFILDMPRH